MLLQRLALAGMWELAFLSVPAARSAGVALLAGVEMWAGEAK